MANPLTTARNKYHSNIKNSTIYTPSGVCSFLFDLLNPVFKNTCGKIIDPSIGSGNLIKTFLANKYEIAGFDINDDKDRPKQVEFINKNFLAETNEREDVSLVICNPPFNTDKRNKDFLKKIKKGKALLPELFIEKSFELYGDDIPLIIITPMGLRLNQRLHSKRWRKMRDEWPEITSIISMPLNIFDNVEFHNEIIIFNIPQLKPHYFIPEKYIKEK